MTRIRTLLAALLGLAMTLGIPAALLLGTSAPAQACVYIVSGAGDPSAAGTPGCGGGSVDYFVLAAAPTTVVVGAPVTLTFTDVTGAVHTDVTAESAFSISSGTCSANVCTPDTAGSVTITAQDPARGGGTASVTVTVLPPDHLSLSPGDAVAAPGQPVSYTVSQVHPDGTVVGDVTASAAVAIDGTPCAGNVCTSTVVGQHLVAATDGTLSGQTFLSVVQPATTFSLTTAPTTVAAGDLVTATLTAVTGVDTADETSASTFSIGSGTCAANVCTPDTPGTVTITGSDPNHGGGTASADVTVLPRPDHLVIDPPNASVPAGQPVTFTVSRAAPDGTVVDDVTSRATVALDGVGCPGSVCTPTAPGTSVVTAIDGTLTGQTFLTVHAGPAASLVITPQHHTLWNNAAPLGFTVTASDAVGNALGDVTAQSSFSVSPDGSCSQSVCTPGAAGPHTVTATYGSLTASTTVDASGPIPLVAQSLPGGRVGTAYSHSVLSWSDATTFAQLDPTSVPPPGLTLSSAGILSGTPTVAGTWTFDVIAANANGSQNEPTTITIAPGTTGGGSATPTVSIGSASVREGNSGRTTVWLTLRLSTVARTPVTVWGHTVNGTARAGKDYVAEHGSVTIPAGRLTVSVPVRVIGDRTKEKNETFGVVLTSAKGATLGTAKGTVTITNDD